jgi:hypothetical protein
VAPPRAGRAAPFLVPWAPAPLQPPAGRDAPAPDPGALDDLAIVFNSRLESKLQRVRNDRCTTAQRSVLGNSCVGVFQPAFDFQFNVRTGGVVADRVAVNVDYDSQREFDASNNIAVRYQGKPGERLQSVEVGNVTFQPPASRFLSAGIPSGNYGVQATGRVGAMRVTGIVAQQKGHVSRDNVFTVGERTRQQVERVIEDIQVESRRFFFTIDPRQLPGYPNIDLLNRPQLQRLAAGLPDSLRPVRLYVYRQLVGATIQNPRGPQLSVRGARNPARQVYEVLRENVDYYVDPSLLWIALVRPLNQNTERLAVAYEVRVNGQPGRNVATGGTPDIEGTEAPQVANLLWEPELQPANAEYFLREIKSVYRLGGEDLQRGSLALKVVTGTSGDQEKPADPSRGETYLQLFGLAQPTNPAAFDVENRVWPRPNDPNVSLAFGADGAQQPLIRDLFVFFPSLQPFARAGLAQPAANPANDTLYRYPNEYLYSAQRPQALYRLLASYQSEGGGRRTRSAWAPSSCAPTPSGWRSTGARWCATATTPSTTTSAPSASPAPTPSSRSRGRCRCATRRTRSSPWSPPPSSASRRRSRWTAGRWRSPPSPSSSARGSPARRWGSSRRRRSWPASPAPLPGRRRRWTGRSGRSRGALPARRAPPRASRSRGSWRSASRSPTAPARRTSSRSRGRRGWGSR